MSSNTSKNNIIRIYTTGLSNGLNALYNDHTEQNIAKIYNELKQTIFEQIPTRFTIIIRHYDPILTDNWDNLKMIKLHENISYLESISKDDEKHKYVISSKFIQTKLPLSEINNISPHIILDFAHIFTYTNNSNTVEHGKYYNDFNPTIHSGFNVLRFGFLGNYISKGIFASDNLIKINDDNSIQTLTSIMRQSLPFLLDCTYHEDPTEKLFSQLIKYGIAENKSLGLQRINSIKHNFENKLIARGISLFDAQDIFIKKIKDIEFVKIISNKLIKSIWDNTIPIDIMCEKNRIAMNIFIDTIVNEITL